MATSRVVARSLKKSATKISGVRRQAVADAATFAVDEATATGGSFYGGRYSMFAEAVKKSDTKKRSMLLVWAKPAGAWSIKTYGRGPSTGAPLLNIAGVGPRPRARAAAGDRRWLRVADRVEERFPELALEQLDQALEG